LVTPNRRPISLQLAVVGDGKEGVHGLQAVHTPLDLCEHLQAIQVRARTVRENPPAMAVGLSPIMVIAWSRAEYWREYGRECSGAAPRRRGRACLNSPASGTGIGIGNT